MERRTDSEIKQQVQRELLWDSRLWSTEINVTVRQGVVVLTGTVPTYAKKLAAQEAAHRIYGVLDVANDVEVRANGRARTDTAIAKAVRHALEWDTLVPEDRIRSTVSGGWVTLEGDVNVWREREDAENAMLNLSGVIGVVNKIQVKPPRVEPEELLAQIEDALERRADREAERLRVEVKDGEVDLWGRVHSWQEKRAVIGSISHAPGVRQVQDHLRIDPYF
jgi:osmotically-inducible protein OsmY